MCFVDLYLQVFREVTGVDLSWVDFHFKSSACFLAPPGCRGCSGARDEDVPSFCPLGSSPCWEADANLFSRWQILDSELFELMHQNGDYTHFYFCYRWFLLDFKRGMDFKLGSCSQRLGSRPSGNRYRGGEGGGVAAEPEEESNTQLPRCDCWLACLISQ